MTSANNWSLSSLSPPCTINSFLDFFFMCEHVSATYLGLKNNFQKLSNPHKLHKIYSVLAKFPQAVALLTVYYYSFLFSFNSALPSS